MRSREHWQSVYSQKAPDKLTWFQSHLERSLAFIRSCGMEPDSRIVDAGGGASTLVDDLLSEGYVNLAVVDLAENAIAATRRRLGDRAAAVEWIVGDITTEILTGNSVDFWHDRAVFHFLTQERDREAYLDQVKRCVKPGGHVLVATFGLDGPEKCSGLPVARYDSKGIQSVFGGDFAKKGEAAEQHETPWGGFQSFVYCLCRRSG